MTRRNVSGPSDKLVQLIAFQSTIIHPPRSRYEKRDVFLHHVFNATASFMTANHFRRPSQTMHASRRPHPRLEQDTLPTGVNRAQGYLHFPNEEPKYHFLITHRRLKTSHRRPGKLTADETPNTGSQLGRFENEACRSLPRAALPPLPCRPR
jgi:hypothetical protein